MQAAGAILHADQTEGHGIALPTAADKVFLMYLLQDGASQHQQSKQNSNLEQPISQLNLDGEQQPTCSLLVFCQTELQPERATRWLQTLLQAVSPQHILVAASLPVRLTYISTAGSCGIMQASSSSSGMHWSATDLQTHATMSTLQSPY